MVGLFGLQMTTLRTSWSFTRRIFEIRKLTSTSGIFTKSKPRRSRLSRLQQLAFHVLIYRSQVRTRGLEPGTESSAYLKFTALLLEMGDNAPHSFCLKMYLE